MRWFFVLASFRVQPTDTYLPAKVLLYVYALTAPRMLDISGVFPLLSRHDMPIKQAAKKYMRQAASRTVRNVKRIATLEYAVKQVLKSVEAKNMEEAKTWLRQAQQFLDKAAQKGIIKKNTAARRLSRLSAKVK
jgi:small subunit ribosomal protein S20